ncbi:MAG: hypothetical protein KF881_07780 [Acidobacteria bacterium]|nr:hypothetical protein [Acidobacteriota bacterium]
MKILIVCLTFFALPLGISAQRNSSKSQSQAPALFRIINVTEGLAPEARTSIAAVKEAEIVFDRPAAEYARSVRLDIPLLDGRVFRAERKVLETRALDDQSWFGKAKIGEYDGDITLTFKGGYVAGRIFTFEKTYEIVPKGNKHILLELDGALFPECAGEVKGEPGYIRETPGATVDSGDRIDVLVVYTASVRTSLGGDAQAQAFAQQAIDASNGTYFNSKIRQRLRLVGAQLTALNETGSFSSELSNLRNDPATATLRNSTNADMVAMLTNSAEACGIGYLMGAPGGNPNNGFSVTARTCAVGNLTFAHELGHNMGSQHNPENGSGPTYPYSYGHWHNGMYRTVMSYVNPCVNGCSRAPYFSNPDVVYAGLPTGIANARDNARSINNTADWIANYRYSGSNVMLSNMNGGGVMRRMATHTVNWTSDNISGNVRIELSRDGGTNWETVAASTPNDGSEAIRVFGKPTQQGRIRIVSLNNTAVSDSSLSNFRIQ